MNLNKSGKGNFMKLFIATLLVFIGFTVHATEMSQARIQSALQSLYGSDCMDKIEPVIYVLSFIPEVKDTMNWNLAQYEKTLNLAKLNLQKNKSNAIPYTYFQNEMKNQENDDFGAPFTACLRPHLNFSEKQSWTTQMTAINVAMDKIQSIKKTVN